MAKKTKFSAAIDPSSLPEGERSDFRVPVHEDPTGGAIYLPVIVLRGARPGPVVGICAAVHGDELNGIRIIHRLLDTLDPKEMSGSILCAPVVNLPAFFAKQRRFPEDELDLNHVFPGSRSGTPSQQYARAFLRTFLPGCDHLIDIHTASEGRVNTLYVRVDYVNDEARRLAELIHPRIILHGKSGDGTLRSAARKQGVPAITLEAGNPDVFQGKMVIQGEAGILRILDHLGVAEAPADLSVPADPPQVCASSRWLRTQRGGLLRMHFELGQIVEKGHVLAEVHDVFGEVVETYKAPSRGIVIGMAQSPLSVPGTRYCHLGALGEPTPEKS